MDATTFNKKLNDKKVTIGNSSLLIIIPRLLKGGSKIAIWAAGYIRDYIYGTHTIHEDKLDAFLFYIKQKIMMNQTNP